MSSPKDVRDGKVSLDSIPIEVLLMVCDYVDANTLIRSLMFVNKKFYTIVADNYLWKKRAQLKYSGSDVAFMLTDNYNEDAFNWKQFVWHTELEENCWRDHKTNTTSTIFSGSHFSEVDAVILTQDRDDDIFLSASRDRSICLWNILATPDSSGKVTHPVVHKPDGHTGWIWDLKNYDDSNFLSCSWDSTVKLWNLADFSQSSEPLVTFKTDAAALAVTSKINFVAVGLFSRQVIAFDPRAHEKHLFELWSHSMSVIDMCLVEDNYLISLSEDKTVSVCDLRTRSTLKSLNLAQRGSKFPLCASYYDNVLFVGDSKDYMHWVDCSNGLFDMLKTVKFTRPEGNDIHRRFKINSVKCDNYGSVITGGNEGVVYIIAPTSPLKIIGKIDDCGSEITSIDYQHDTLVVGYVNSDVQVWKKK